MIPSRLDRSLLFSSSFISIREDFFTREKNFLFSLFLSYQRLVYHIQTISMVGFFYFFRLSFSLVYLANGFRLSWCLINDDPNGVSWHSTVNHCIRRWNILMISYFFLDDSQLIELSILNLMIWMTNIGSLHNNKRHFMF